MDYWKAIHYYPSEMQAIGGFRAKRRPDLPYLCTGSFSLLYAIESMGMRAEKEQWLLVIGHCSKPGERW